MPDRIVPMTLQRLATATALALALGSAAHAQISPPAGPQSIESGGSDIEGHEPAGPSRPAPRDQAGHPDLTGFWKPLREAGKPGGNIGKDLPNHQLPFTAEGERIHQFNLTKTIDPEALCILGGIPRHNASGLPFEIIQSPQRTAFLYLYTTHRLIPIDGRTRDPDPDPLYFGNPLGRWEGDTLVIDTVGFKDSKDGKLWMDENGDPQSDATHVVERWTRPDFDHVHLEMTVDDPKYYQHPFGFSRTWVLGKPGEGLTEYACNENNIDREALQPGPGVIRADGTRGYEENVKLPDNPPGPEAYLTAAKPAKAKSRSAAGKR